MAQISSHKTIIVLDHSSYFAHSSKQLIEYDILSKIKTPGIIPAAPITKSLWTVCVETVIEYLRVVYDIFPTKKLVRVVTGSEVMNSWAQKDQNVTIVMNNLAAVGPPKEDEVEDYDVVSGLTKAIEVMCQPSDLQHTLRTSLADNEAYVENRGRIICLTNLKSDAQVRMLEGCVSDALNEHNSLAEETDNRLPISFCELVLIHVVPVGDVAKVSERAKHEVSPNLMSEVHVSQSGKLLYNKMIQLVMEHYNLASTTVTGIPMKEEQNASSSANYDVELLHPTETHQDLFNSGNAAEGLIVPSKEGLGINTVTLKWCTPKTNTVEIPPCTTAHRITPVDVNSRPSSCLTNFLLSGRAVMLEQPRKTGSKVISHMLASHGGEIFIHTIPVTRSILEDPPSISEGLGGRVTDYRIPDFREFMKENRLAPALPSMISEDRETPLERAKKHLERTSRCWPMVISETIIFNMASHIDPLPRLIVKEKLDEDDVLECKKAIYHVVGMESRNEPLPVTAIGSRGKGPKREEQYRQMWSELETLVRLHAATSPMHQKVLDCLLECKKPDDSKASPRKGEKSVHKEEKMEVSEAEKSWKDIERYQKMTEREKLELNKGDYSEESGPSTKRIKSSSEEPLVRSGGGQNLLSLWTNRIKVVHSMQHVQFAGRAEGEGKAAVLYKQLLEKENEAEATDPPAASKR